MGTIGYSDCDALKSAASLSNCRPSSPDMACHHVISVAAQTGEADMTATATAASCKNLKVDLTIKPFQSGAVETLSSRHAPKPRAGRFKSEKADRGAALTISARRAG